MIKISKYGKIINSDRHHPEGKYSCSVSIIVSNGRTKTHILSHSLYLAQILSESDVHFSV